MKKMTKIASLVLALVMLVVMAAPVFAVNTEETPNTNAHTITIGNTNDKHTFEAYQVFRGDIADGKLTNITWGNGVNGAALLAALKADPTIGIDFADCADAEATARVLEGYADDSAKLDAFAAVAGKHLTATFATSSFNEGVCTVDVVGDGYYLVKDKDNSLDNEKEEFYTKYILKVVGDVSVTAKIPSPEQDKNIEEEGKKVKYSNGSIGDTVNYIWDSKVPNMDGYKWFIFIMQDTMSKGLSFNNDVVVKMGDKVLKHDVVSDDGSTTQPQDYYVVRDGQTFKVVFRNFIQYKEMVGTPIQITYSADITNEVEIEKPEGLINTAKLIYSRNPNESGEGGNEPGPGDVVGETPEVKTQTFVTGLKLTKTDEDGKILTGAKFKIEGTGVNVTVINGFIFRKSENGNFYRLKDGTYTDVKPVFEENGYTADKYESTEIKYEKIELVDKNTTSDVEAEGWVDANGIITFVGLGAGTYTITELVAPDGYNLLEEPIIINIAFEYDEVNHTGVWTVTRGEEKLTADENGLFTFSVVNKSGIVLPSTGGIGTTIFYVAGAALALCAVVLLVTRKRMSVEG